MIVYKVVMYVERDDCYISIFTWWEEYLLRYHMGEIIKANVNTLGIFCFENLVCAQFFANYICRPMSDVHILEAESIGRVTIPKIIAANCFSSIDNFYKRRSDPFITFDIPKGTICYPAIKVLNEIDILG